MHLQTSAFLALGGNLGDPRAAFRRTRRTLSEHPAIAACRASPLYQTPPVGGPPGQPDYLNAVLCLKTSLLPRELFELCRSLETAEGRERTEHWGARTLDIDLLLYGDLQIDEPDLQIPHPRMLERRFVLEPLTALAPELSHPTSGLQLQLALENLAPDENIKILERNW